MPPADQASFLNQRDKGRCHCAQHVCMTLSGEGGAKEDGWDTNIECKGAIFTQRLYLLCVCLLGDRDFHL